MKKLKIIGFFRDYGILLSITIVPVFLFLGLVILKPAPMLGIKQVHWHMPISYNLCGDKSQLKDSWQHGKLHGHDDNQVHVEWIVNSQDRVETLGLFFDAANINFSETQIGKYKNGDICPNSSNPWKLSVMINGEKNTDFRNYILNDKDIIEIVFN